MGSKISIGFISAAHHHCDSYIPTLLAMPEVTVIGITDDDSARRAEYAQRYHLTPFDSVASLLHEKPQAVVICSMNAEHRQHVEAAAAAGAHILCEKPLATTLADAEAMVDSCHRAGVLLMPAFPMRYSAPIVESQQSIAQIGAIRGGSATNQGQLPISHRSWFIEPQAAGGGAIMDHTVHVADILRWLLNSEVESIWAACHHITHPIAKQVDTGALMMLNFHNGAHISLDCSWSRPDRYPTWGGLTLSLIGDHGVIETDAFRENNRIYGEQSRPVIWDFWGADANKTMMLDFVRAIRERRVPQVNARDGLAAQQIIDAAYRSYREQRVVMLGTS